MHNQQNSAPHTAQVMWLHVPSSSLMMNAPHRGHGFMSSPDKLLLSFIGRDRIFEARRLSGHITC